MSWIRIIGPAEAEGALREIYQRIGGPGGQVDNVLQIHSLRPHTLEAHMALYKNVLHHRGNLLPKWLLETVGIYVTLLNRRSYCVEHHFAGLRRLLKADERTRSLRKALETNEFAGVFDRREAALLAYARELTCAPGSLRESAIEEMRGAGLSDGEILEVNQVVSYLLTLIAPSLASASRLKETFLAFPQAIRKMWAIGVIHNRLRRRRSRPLGSASVAQERTL